MKVKTYILLRSRQFIQKNTRESKLEIEYKKGIYLMSREATNFYSKEDHKPQGVEIFFYEGNPGPIPIDEEDKDESIKFLDNYIYENAIQQTADSPKERLKGGFTWAKDNITIEGVIKWGFILMIVIAGVGGQLGLW